MVRPVFSYAAVFLFLFLCCAAPAHAHAPVPGIEGFYVGLLDPFSAAPQLVLLFALGLLTGGFGNRRAIGLLSAFLVASLAGIVLGAGIAGVGPALLGTAALCSAVAATAPGRFLVFSVAAATVAGFLIGAASIPDPGPMRDRIVTVLGSFVGANVGLLYIAGGVLFMREKYSGRRMAVSLRLASALACAIAIVLLVFGLDAGA